MTDSLTIARVIDLLNNKAVSTLPQCAGAQFMLAPGFDVGAPQPDVDVVASLLLDGERPYGRRFSNRTITLPIVIQAPTRAILAAARETLLNIIHTSQTFELTWTRDYDLGGLPLVFDCFRALATTIGYSTKLEKQSTKPTAQLQISFQALPFGRSDSIETLTFAAPTIQTTSPPAPVLIDDFNSVASTTQPTWWSQSTQAAIDTFSAYWNWQITDQDSGPFYSTNTLLGGPVNITGLTALSFWFGLGTTNFNTWSKGNVTFQITLTDGTHTLTFGATVYCAASNSPTSPQWTHITASIPQGNATFNYAAVTGYSIHAWRFISQLDGDQELDSSAYINGLYAVASTGSGGIASVRGAMYSLNAVKGTAPAPLGVQIQQQAANPVPMTTTFSTPGAISFIPPAGNTTLLVGKMGAAGRGGRRTTSGQGAGAQGAEWVQVGQFPCAPGVPITGYVGGGGGSGGSIAFVQRVATGKITSTSGTTLTASVTASTATGHTLFAWVGGGTTSATVNSITDAKGNAWSLVYKAPTGSTSGRFLELWSTTISNGLVSGDHITVTLSTGSSSGVACIVDEFSGVGNADNTPVFSYNSGTNNPTVTGTMGASEALAVSACISMGPGQSPTVGTPLTSTGSDVSTQIGGSTGCDLLASYELNPAAGNLTANYHEANSHSAVTIVLAFAAAAAGPVNGQDTWFGANDLTTAHGSFGIPDNQSSTLPGYVTVPPNSLTGQNAGFEGGVGTWVASTNGAVPVSTAAQAHSGANSMLMSSTAAGAMLYSHTNIGSIFPNGIPVQAGQFVGISGWFRTQASARTCTVSVEFFDNTGTSLGNTASPGVTDGTGAWVQASTTVIAPANAQACRLRAQVAGTTVGGEVHYFDDGYIAVLGAILPNFLTGQNANFDGGIGTWVPDVNSTLAPTSSQFHSGTGSMQMTSVSGTGRASARMSANLPATIIATGMVVSAGDTITASAWFKAGSTGQQTGIIVGFFDVNGNSLSFPLVTGPNDTTTGWTQCLGTFLAPANSEYAILFPEVTATGGGGEVHYIDDCYMTDGASFDGGQGAAGSTTGGGGGSSAGNAANGNPASGATPGSAPTGGAAGGTGGAAGNNPGTAGGNPGGGGAGASSTGTTESAGQGGNGEILVTYTQALNPFKTAVIHRPGTDAPALLNPLVPVGNGLDLPNGGTEYPVTSPVVGQNARFYGTYTVVAVNQSWDTPSAARTVQVTVKQYEYLGGPAVSATTDLVTIVPNTNDASGNGMMVLGEITLPIRDLAPDQTSAFFTVLITDSNTADRFLDVLFLDTQGQTILLDLNAATGYNNYWVDPPDPFTDLGRLIGSTYDRSQAVSVLDSAIWAGGPMAINPGLNSLLVYAKEGQPALVATYAPRWFTERLL